MRSGRFVIMRLLIKILPSLDLIGTPVSIICKASLHGSFVLSRIVVIENTVKEPLHISPLTSWSKLNIPFAKGSFLPRDRISHEQLPRLRVQPSIPFVDSDSLVQVGGRVRNAGISYASRHPIIFHGKHPMKKLIISSEHSRLLHAGPTLVMASLCRQYHIIGCRKAVRSITRKCVTCR